MLLVRQDLQTKERQFALRFACLCVEGSSALMLVRGSTGAVTGNPGMTIFPGRDARDTDKLSGLSSGCAGACIPDALAALI